MTIKNDETEIKIRKQGQISSDELQKFKQLLSRETDLLKEWFKKAAFTEHELEGGFELEFFLLDKDFNPAPDNLQFIKQIDNPHVVSEVGAAHLELNSMPFSLAENAITRSAESLSHLWNLCQQQADKSDYEITSIGCLPTARQEHHGFHYMTKSPRYFSLDTRMHDLRQGDPIQLDIEGDEHLQQTAECLSVDGLASSFQIHMRVGFSQSLRYYNAAQIIAAPMVALSCNAPFLLGHNLQAETRISLFEQVMALPYHQNIKICDFGDDYLKTSLFELYEKNLQRFPCILPILNETSDPEAMWHVRKQNSAVHRWNRPVLDFDSEGRTHLRIEHRPLSAGPTLPDMLANAAMFYGLLHYFASLEHPPENSLPFADAKANFYHAVHDGLDAQITWFGEKRHVAHELLLDELLPLAMKGLHDLGVNQAETRNHLSIIKNRLRLKRSGASWQRDFIQKHGRDFHAMMAAYVHWQKSGDLLHDWKV